MPALEGVLERHRTVRDAWAVGVLKVTAADADAGFDVGDLAPVVGAMLGMVAPGESLELDGEPEERPPYGTQFRIQRQTSLGINTARHAARFLERLDGVGPILAHDLFTHFGESILDALNSDPEPHETDPLTAVKGIGAERALLIRESWAGVGSSGNVDELRYLDGLGCSRWEVQQVLKACSKRRPRVAPRDLLGEQPYTLLDAHGLGFLRVDSLARRAGCSPEAPARIMAGALHAIDRRVDEHGHTRIPYGRLVTEAATMLNVDAGLVISACNALKARGLLVVDATVRPLTVTRATLLEAAAAVFEAVTLDRARAHGEPVADACDECQPCAEPAAEPAAERTGAVFTPDTLEALIDQAAARDPHSEDSHGEKYPGT